jgi:O-methyltransferase involved in polyketide biosynthesis
VSAIRLLGFACLCLLVSPLVILGTSLYSLHIFTVGRPRGISGTAYEPLWSRLFLDELGLREDRAAARLAPHLPATSPFIIWCVSGLICWAARISGYRGAFFTYPPEHPIRALALVNHRCEFFDRTLREAVEPQSGGPGAQQVVILGAGWDSRAYGGLKGKDVRFFEVDMPPTQGVKKAALRKGGIDTDHVTFVETDFDQRSWFNALQDHGFDPALPTFVLWEGVTMYLDEDAVRSTLGHVEELAPGSSIAFDYLSRELVFGKRPFTVIGKLFSGSIKLYYGEAFRFGISTRPPARNHVAALFKEAELALTEHEPFGGKLSWGGLVLVVRPLSAE